MTGKKYTLVIVDEFSRYTWVFFIRSKSDTLDEIVSFFKKMEVLNNLTVRSIRSDMGLNSKALLINSLRRKESLKTSLLSKVRSKMKSLKEEIGR